MTEIIFDTLQSLASQVRRLALTVGELIPSVESIGLQGLFELPSSFLEPDQGCIRLTISTASLRGRRSYMEDTALVAMNNHLIGVFDGHGKGHVAKYLKHNMLKFITALLPQDEHKWSDEIVGRALQQSMRKADAEVLKHSEWDNIGSTAVLVFVNSNRSIVSANLGDSRSVLARQGVAINVTTDHKPGTVTERSRIEKLGGCVTASSKHNRWGQPIYRINFQLSLSRAIGA